MENHYRLKVTRICLNCGEEIQSDVYKDVMGFFCSCPECDGSFDIDLTDDELKQINEEEK